MSRVSRADRLSVAGQRRLSDMSVGAGKRLGRLNRRRGNAPGAPALRRAERALFRFGLKLGRRSRAQWKEAKRRADARDEDRPDRVSNDRTKALDLRAMVSEHHAAETERVRRELAVLAAGDDPVLAGPFVGEVGSELLYWVPFVKWVLQEFPRLRGRLILGTRGGTGTWYGEAIGDYADVLDVFSPEEFAERRVGFKQREWASLELEFLSAVAERAGLREPKILHPALMWYGYARAVKADERSYPRAVHSAAPQPTAPLVGLRSVYSTIAPPPLGELEETLPPEFVAARFYFGPPFPDTSENRAFASWFLTALSERIPVVLLNNGLELDDHVDVELESPRIITLEDQMTPATNLAVQTAVVARARAFVGTYGGLAYLPPHLGVPSLAFMGGGIPPYTRHLELAQRIFQDPPWGSLAVLSTRDLDVLELFVGMSSAAAAG